MRNRQKSQSNGVVRSGAYVAIMAIIVVKTIGAILNTIVRTVDDLRDSRQSRRA